MSLAQEGHLQLTMESELASASSKQTKNQTTAGSRAVQAGNTYARAISVFLKIKPKGWTCLSAIPGGAGLVCWAGQAGTWLSLVNNLG